MINYKNSNEIRVWSLPITVEYFVIILTNKTVSEISIQCVFTNQQPTCGNESIYYYGFYQAGLLV